VVLDTGRQMGSPIDDLVPAARRIGKAIEAVIEGKRDAIQLTLAVLLAEGHLLIEDVPGVGKTMLAKALARAIDGTVRRVQFTPDLLPSDITGVSAYNQERRDFEFQPGPRSTGPRLRLSPRCSNAWKNVRSPSTAPRIPCRHRSW
jgi:MoxR-like ATPase